MEMTKETYTIFIFPFCSCSISLHFVWKLSNASPFCVSMSVLTKRRNSTVNKKERPFKKQKTSEIKIVEEKDDEKEEESTGYPDLYEDEILTESFVENLERRVLKLNLHQRRESIYGKTEKLIENLLKCVNQRKNDSLIDKLDTYCEVA